MTTPRELDFTWRDPSTGLVHAARAEGLRLVAAATLGAARVFTKCGLRIRALSGPEANQGEVTCILCLEGDWLPGLFETLESPAGELVHVA
ncbi:MAG: hypothetical protein AB7U23_15700 [Dehalococcoidia bacterium]